MASEHFARMNPLERIAPVAQLDRVSGYEPEGREFESCRARQLIQRMETQWTAQQ